MEKKDKEKRHTKRGAQRDNKNWLNSKIDISEFLFPPNFRFCCYDSFQKLNCDFQLYQGNSLGNSEKEIKENEQNLLKKHKQTWDH